MCSDQAVFASTSRYDRNTSVGVTAGFATTGVGGQEPCGTESTLAGRAKNRRGEVNIASTAPEVVTEATWATRAAA